MNGTDYSTHQKYALDRTSRPAKPPTIHIDLSSYAARPDEYNDNPLRRAAVMLHQMADLVEEYRRQLETLSRR